MSEPADRPDLEPLCAYWKQVLGISATTVLRYVRVFDMEDQTCQGSCNYCIASDTALIKIVEPSDYDPSFWMPQDVEQTLVHELLHIPFEYFAQKDGTLEHKMWEQVIDKAACALVKLNRGERPE